MNPFGTQKDLIEMLQNAPEGDLDIHIRKYNNNIYLINLWYHPSGLVTIELKDVNK